MVPAKAVRKIRVQAFVASCAGTILLFACVSAPAQTPELIPRTALFSNAEHNDVTISPDGRSLAYLAPSEQGVANVWIENPATHEKRMVTHADHRGIPGYEWSFDSGRILYFSDENGNEDFHLYYADLKSGAVRDLTPFQGIQAQVLLKSPARPKEILIGMNLRDRRLFDMYRVDLDTGGMTLDTQNPGDVIGWTADENLVIRAATAFTDKLETVVRVRDSQKAPWRDLLSMPFEQAPFLGQVNGGNVVVGFSKGGKKLTVGSSKGSPTTRLVELDVASGKELRVLASDPRADMWQVFAQQFITLIDPRDLHIQAVAFNYLKPEWRALDAATEADFKYLAGLRAGVFAINSRDTTGNQWTVAFFSDVSPTSFYLYDRAAHKATLLFRDNPVLQKYTLAEMKPLEIPTRDGFKLVSYLTLPAGGGKNLPLVLSVHGGPWARDEWGYDAYAQWLANRGYAVLQVNYRASNVNEPYMNAGNNRIGTGTDDDLTDAVQWTIQQGIADPKRIAIMGASFGGYSVLRGLTLHPDLYACGVDVVGPSDMATLMNSIPDYWQPVKKRWLRRIGDVTTDSALNQKISPLYHAADIHVPLLIGHGLHDPRVKVEQSIRIADTIRKNGGAVTLIVYSDEGHGFERPENNLDFNGRTEEFLHGCIGGRYEPWRKVPGATGEVQTGEAK